MKPLRIKFEAFGSYPDKVSVDFTSLEPRGLFVISGDTGSGKSTIFDAMCFALYGEMPSKDAREARSHHAEPDNPTEVRFDFEVDNVEYRATRTPEYKRPKARGTGTTKQLHKATLERIEPDGSTTAIETRVTNVKNSCEQLVGLSAEQFMRVVLLPQGEVQKFLLAGSGEREGLLGQLFGGQIYDRVVDNLKTRFSTLEQQVDQVDEDLRHHLATARAQLRVLCETLSLGIPEDIDELDDAAVKEGLNESTKSSKAKTEADEAQAIANTATRESERANTEAQRFDSARLLEKEKQSLDSSTPLIEANEQTAQASTLARPAVKAEGGAITAEEKHKQAKQSLQQRLDEIETIAKNVYIAMDVSTAATIATSMAAAYDDVREKRRLVDTVKTASQGVTDANIKAESVNKKLALTLQEIKSLENRIGELDERRPQLEQQQGDLTALESDKTALELALKKAAELEQLLLQKSAQTQKANDTSAEAKKLWDRFVATQAPRLAADLIEGDPCPVCGSLEHPTPAAEETGELVSFDHVEQAKETEDSARSKLDLTDKKIAEIQAVLGNHAMQPIKDIENNLEHAKTRLTQAKQAKIALEELDQELQAKNHNLNAAHISGASFTTEKNNAAEAVELATSSLEIAQQAVADIDTIKLELADTATNELKKLVLKVDTLFQDLSSFNVVARERRKTADSLLESSPFTTIKSACAALLETQQETTWLEDAKSHRDSGKENRARYDQLVKQGIPEQRPDSDTRAVEANQKNQESARLNRLHTTANNAANHCKMAIKTYRAEAAGSGELRNQFNAAHRAFTVCKSGGNLKIPLRRWVLANELDRVTAAANVHLRKMTAGRYSLARIKEWVKGEGGRAFGLDLEVMDAHTGKSRRPKSLSGGEQFQASLALALGLADVVSHGGTASGRNFDALFIDEGFGSLDERTLDLAIDTLHELHATGRMVGIITHVETMKQRLHVGIQVSRLENGEGSTLEVRV